MLSEPFLGCTAPPSPAISGPKTDRGRSSTSAQLPPSSLPAILADSEFRLGLINSSRPRPLMAGSVPPDVHSCSQTLAWSSYFRIPPYHPTTRHSPPFPLPSCASLLPAPAGSRRKSGAWRRPAQENPASLRTPSCPLP